MKSEDSSEIITSNSRCRQFKAIRPQCAEFNLNKDKKYRCDWNGVSVKTQGLLSSLFSKDD